MSRRHDVKMFAHLALEAILMPQAESQINTHLPQVAFLERFHAIENILAKQASVHDQSNYARKSIRHLVCRVALLTIFLMYPHHATSTVSRYSVQSL